MKKILVLCTGNSARSQLAQAYLQYFAGGRAEVYSAGVNPKGVNPVAIQVMAEDGIDISHHTAPAARIEPCRWVHRHCFWLRNHCLR